MDSKITLTIQSIFKGEGFKKAAQATKGLSKDIQQAGGAVKDLAGEFGQLGGQVGKAAGGLGKLIGLMGTGTVGLLVAGVTAIVGAFVKWRDTMKQVEEKMLSLSRSRHEDMWSRLHKRIAEAAKAQSEFFDDAIEKGQRLLAYAKAEQTAKNAVRNAQTEAEVADQERWQSTADKELAKRKRQNSSTMSKDDAEYANQQLDLENQRHHIDTQRRIENILHKARMQQIEDDIGMLLEEKKSKENESAKLAEQDETNRIFAKRKKDAADKEIRDLENDQRYQDALKKKKQLEKEGADSSYSASDRDRYWDNEKVLEDFQKKIEAKRQESLRFEKEYNDSAKANAKKQEDIAHRLKLIPLEIEALMNQQITQQRNNTSKNEELDAKYEGVWQKITEASNKHLIEKAEKEFKDSLRRMENDAKSKANRYKTPEFKAAIMAESKVQRLQQILGHLEDAVITRQFKNGKWTETRRSLKEQNPELYKTTKEQYEEAVREWRNAHKAAVNKRNEMWQSGAQIMSRFEQSEINRGYSELERLARKMQSEGLKNDGMNATSRQYQQTYRELKEIEKSLMSLNELRTRKADEGLAKQEAIENELQFIHQIEDRTRAAIEQIEQNTRTNAEQNLTGEGRAQQRNAEKDERVNNAKVQRRIQQQENAAKRDTWKGWGLDRNGNLVKKRRNAENLSNYQKRRLQDHLRRKRLEKEGEGLNARQKELDKVFQKNVKQVSDKLIEVRDVLKDMDTHILDTMKLK